MSDTGPGQEAAPPARPNANYMTEAEAEQRWCFYAQPNTGRYSDTPAPTGAYAQTRCNASGCLAWRWNTTGSATTPPTYGFCGLAGSPSLT